MAFDRYMIQIRAGAHPKLRGLTVEERYAFFLGLLSLAAQADPRGSLQLGGRAVDWQDVARECSVRGQVANRMLAKLRQIGVIERSDDGTEWVHDFDDYNPQPRSDATNAARQARWRERQRTARNGVTDAPVTLRNAGEVKKLEEEGPPLPPLARNGRRRRVNKGGRGTAPNPGTEGGVEGQPGRSSVAPLLERLPGVPEAHVRNAIRALNAQGIKPTVEMIRDYLNQP